jgi:hypothetical protein
VEGAVKDLLLPAAPREPPEELLLLKEGAVGGLLTLPEGGLKDRLLPIAEGAPREPPEGLLLLKEREVEGLLTLPEGGLKDRLLPVAEGALEEPSCVELIPFGAPPDVLRSKIDVAPLRASAE